ncbi:MAG: NCS2 family permease [Thermoanaerobaculia bacterium]|nr:NCS2 family permease [Thermoanaerobaculia bacterium]
MQQEELPLEPRSGLGESLFRLTSLGTTVGTEIRAGVVTFLTMAYILFVNAQILSDAGMPAESVVIATAIASAVATLAMGLLTNYPFALAPGMGLNAYFAYTVVGGMGLSWQQALAAVFVAGLLFLALSFGGARTAVLEAIPKSLAIATSGGIGLFLAFIGLEKLGLVVDHPATLVTLGDLTSPSVLLGLVGLLLLGLLTVLKVRGALLYGILALTGISWLSGLASAPARWVTWPTLPDTLWAFDFTGLFTPAVLTAVIAFLFVDLFDTAGTLLGVSRLGGFLDDEGRLPRADRAFLADAIGSTAGAMVGTSPVTTYIESATGIEEGGRSGLTAVTVSCLFLLSLFLTPIFVAVPAIATAPVLILVGALMMRALPDIPWSDPSEALPAFLVLCVMPLTFSIANGIALGIVSWVLLKAGSGRWREVPPVLFVLSLLLVLFYGFS